MSKYIIDSGKIKQKNRAEQQLKLIFIRLPFYEHSDRARNGGGITLRYSVPEEKFYGNYSHH